MGREIAYRSLASRLRIAIGGGEFDGGRPLPTEEQLSATYAVSRHTVRRAMQDLVAEGLIYRVAGRGTYPVVNRDRYLRQFGSVEDLMALSEDTECEVLVPLGFRVDIDGASRLRQPSDSVMALTLRRLHHGLPLCVTTVTLPPGVGKVVEDVPELALAGSRSRVTVIGLIDGRIPLPITAVEQSVSAAPGPPSVTAHLDCEPGEPVLRVDRLYMDDAGDPVELAVSYFDPRRYSYRVSLRRGPA